MDAGPGFDMDRVFELKPPSDWQLNTHISLKNRYVFFQVCKAAGSTVVYHLQTVEFQGSHWRVQDPRNKHLSPHLSPYQIPDGLLVEAMTSTHWRRIAFVRDPFARLLSCYLHRIVARPDSPSAKHYRRVSGDDDTPTFGRFLEVICKQRSRDMERHWRIQADEALADLVNLDFVGKVEQLRADLKRLSVHLFGEQVFHPDTLDEVNASPMQTRAADRLTEYYTPELVEMVADRYSRDFEQFGYPSRLVGV